MKTIISQTPAKDAGTYISEKIATHKRILLLLSGGSALSVLEHISTSALTQQVTVSMLDERFTNDEEGSNFKQLQQTAFYAKALENQTNFIDSFPKPDERHEQFSERIKEELENYYEKYFDGYTLALFGIGEDGHTAGIFPTSESEFNQAYKTDALYVPVTQPQAKYPFRTTVTPAFIEDKIVDVVLFAVGSLKCDNILNYIHNKNFSHSQIPALIPAQHPQSILFTDCQTLQNE